METKKFAVIVAGGSGTRMGSNIPKQFLAFQGKPILMHTLEAFQQFDPALQIILVLPENEIPQWEALCQQHNFHLPVILQKGGKNRCESVKNGLDKITSEGLVAIHDGVRPFIDSEIIAQSFRTAQEKGNAVTAVSLKDSIREVEGENSRLLDRSKFRLVQTPQTFRVEDIKAAYTSQTPEALETLTDDASVAEKAGQKIQLIEGSYENIKITTPEDLYIAEAIWQKRKKH
jgi:2-C-methyl-D-erythritol 4-phosphate cytidylyltransferase